MNLSWFDWSIVLVAVVSLRYISLKSASHMKGIAGFLSANRSAGRYLITIASQMGGLGPISFVAMFEMYYGTGFTPIWWGFMTLPVGAIILLTGWVFYRFRETRALTMAQFFEMRYSKRFRVFSGILCWATGVLNFGIFPGVAARFFMYFCGLPERFHIPGIEIGISTFATIMLVDLVLALLFVTRGGQISVMVTECVQGIFCSFAFITVAAVILLQFQWPKVVKALNTAPANASMLNPFDTSGVTDFNVWYFLITVFATFYGYMTWQGTSGFNSAARSPHEQKMGGIIGVWRGLPQLLVMMLLTLAAFTVLNLPEYASKAALINEKIRTISNVTVQGQMRVPIAIAYILPIGIKGLLTTVLVFSSFTCHDTSMHSWGTIFIQDVYMPIRKRPIEPAEHIRLLRWSIIGVGVFGFLFSLFYPPTQKIFMFMAITGTIWIAGSGAVIIGGLYWKRGTTPGAYAALIIGAILGVGGLIVPEIYKSHYHHDFPVNSQWLYFIAMCLASIVYVTVSLLTGRREHAFNLERILHRGKYANASESVIEEMPQSRWLQVVGITKDFSRGDRVLAIALVVWNAAWFGTLVVATIVNYAFHGISDTLWASFWHFYIWIYFLVGIPATVWFAVGGLIDMKLLFKALSMTVHDQTDDGRVIHAPERDVEIEVPLVAVDSQVRDMS